MSDIKPRIDEHGVGWCHDTCPHFDSELAHTLSDPSERELCMETDSGVCPVHARRVAAERDRLREWAREAKSYINFATGVASNKEVYDDGVALLATYPGEEE